MFRIISKRELALYVGTIGDLRAQVKKLEDRIEHEQKRAEAAINLLLLRTQRAAITPEPTKAEIDQDEHIKNRMLNIFGDDELVNAEDEKRLEELQG